MDDETPSLPPDFVPEPLPPVPTAAAQAIAPDVLARLTTFGEQLADAGVLRGLIGPREVPRLWDRHLLNCAALGSLIKPGELVADIGSGAGLPGLVLALTRPDIRIILVEPLQRRCAFLQEMLELFDLEGRVEIRRGKAHMIEPCQADVVTSRAVAALDKLAGWSFPHARIGGRLLAMKGQRAAEELAAAKYTLRKWGAETDAKVLVREVPGSEDPLQVISAPRRK